MCAYGLISIVADYPELCVLTNTRYHHCIFCSQVWQQMNPPGVVFTAPHVCVCVCVWCVMFQMSFSGDLFQSGSEEVDGDEARIRRNVERMVDTDDHQMVLDDLVPDVAARLNEFQVQSDEARGSVDSETDLSYVQSRCTNNVQFGARTTQQLINAQAIVTLVRKGSTQTHAHAYERYFGIRSSLERLEILRLESFVPNGFQDKLAPDKLHTDDLVRALDSQ